jgi:cell division protein FtsL
MKKEQRFLFFSLAVSFLLAIFHLYVYTKNIGLHYEVNVLKMELRQVHDQNRNLSSIVARKRSLFRINQAATEKLGMSRPEKVNYILTSPERR